jgi:hypothetical protein
LASSDTNQRFGEGLSGGLSGAATYRQRPSTIDVPIDHMHIGLSPFSQGKWPPLSVMPRVSRLAEDDGQVVRGHVVDLLQLKAFGGCKKRDILQVTDAPFRVSGPEQLIKGFVAG